MPKDTAHLNVANLTTAIQPWVDARKRNPGILGERLGVALAELPDSYGFDSMDLKELLNGFTATVLSKGLPRVLALHAKLSEVAGLNKEYSFGYADRYAMVFADTPQFKSMAFQTQSLTYMVALRAKTAYPEFSLFEGMPPTMFEKLKFETFAMDLRLCTGSLNSLNYARPALDTLRPILESVSAMKASEYFRYRDGRDRGYLASMYPDTTGATLTGPVFETKDMNWNAAMSYLRGVWSDLTAHASCLDEIQPES